MRIIQANDLKLFYTFVEWNHGIEFKTRIEAKETRVYVRLNEGVCVCVYVYARVHVDIGSAKVF